MEDRYNEILSQYDFEVTARSRIRGGIMIETDAGCKIVKETKTSAGRLVWEHKVKSHLKEAGFGYIDSFCLNRDNNISSIGTNGQRYVVRDWYPGSECDIHNVKDVYAASVNMAVLHNCLKGIPPYEYSMCAGAQDIVTTLKKHNKSAIYSMVIGALMFSSSDFMLLFILFSPYSSSILMLLNLFTYYIGQGILALNFNKLY